MARQLETEVVVIAAGTAGLPAAIAAAEKGANVTVFEKASATGGTGNMAGGLFAVESRLQRLKQMGLTREEAFRIHMDFTHYNVDARLVKKYYDMSADTIDWLEKMGVEFVEPAGYFPGSQFTWHTVKSPGSASGEPGSANVMMKIMTERAKALGVKILLQTPVKKIIKRNNQIAGVFAEDRSGEEIQANAKAVIIATGGFGDNPEWMKKYLGFEWGKNLFSDRIPGVTGDGIRMAWEVGAGDTKMTMDTIYGPPNFGPLGEIGIAFHQPNLVVNQLGERFMNEDIMDNNAFTSNAINMQKNKCAFSILNENIFRCFEETGWDFIPVRHTVTKPGNLQTSLEQALAQGYQYIYVANSIEELAVKLEIKPEALRNTVDCYNQACDSGRDTLLNKNVKYLRPLKQPRFIAAKLYSCGFGTLGGIKINYKTEVITKGFDVIPGLYAAGTDANALYSDSYPFPLPGNTMGFAINSGRIAGENAAEYVKHYGK